MNIGTLRHRLVIEAPVETPDEAGGVSREFEAVATVWGRIEPTGGDEARLEDRLLQRLTHRVVLRARPTLTAAHRLRHGARLFDICAIRQDVPARRFIACDCEENAP